MSIGTVLERGALRRFLCTSDPDPREIGLIVTWATAVAAGSDVSTLPTGRAVEMDGAALEALQVRTNRAFVPPVRQVDLVEPFLAFRFYGDLCQRVTQMYTSLRTVILTPGFGDFPRNLLGLTGRNSASNLVAVQVAAGSRIVIGGISNRAEWADQILVDTDRGTAVVANLSRYCLPP